MKKIIISLLIATLLLSNFMVAFAANMSDVVIVSPLKGNILTLDADITDIIGGKNVKLNMSLEVNNKNLLTLGGNEYIKYTLDGSSPEKGEYYYYYSGPVSPQYQESYTNEINLTEEGLYTIRAIAQKSGCKSEEYTTQIKVEKISTPTIILENDVATIRTNISGAAIYYTTDGDEPTTSSTKYTEPINLEKSTLLKAIAVKKGYVTSEIGKKHIAIEINKDSCTECSVCGDEIADDVVYDENNQPICQQCTDELSKDEEQYIELKCPHCSEILEISENEYNEREYIVCPDCMKFIIYKGEDTEYECFDCGETFYYSETKIVENGKIYCPYCNEIVDGDNTEKETKCYICGEYFNDDDMIYDEDDNLICQDCYDELQNKDEELFYIQCPYCEDTFEDNEDIYDEDGYAVCPYCEGLIDTSEEIAEEIEFEFITSDWAAEEVYEAYQNNLIPFEMLETALYKTISREEFAAVAVKLYENIVGEIPDIDIYDTPFTDCNYASEYNAYIAVAYELGITKGTSDTAFSPYENITREQLATMLCRTLLIASGEDIDIDRLGRPDLLNMEDTAVSFADENEISDFAKASVHILASRDIIKGVDDSHFAPKETATKEQSILISVRCVKNLFNSIGG